MTSENDRGKVGAPPDQEPYVGISLVLDSESKRRILRGQFSRRTETRTAPESATTRQRSISIAIETPKRDRSWRWNLERAAHFVAVTVARLFAATEEPRPAAQRSRRVLLARLFVAALATILLLGTYRAGLVRGLEQVLGADALGRHVTAIASLMTVERYKQRGYAVADWIMYELQNRGLTTDPAVLEKVGAPPNHIRSALFIDSVIGSVWRDLHKLPDSNFRGFGADDIGLVDYTKVAFSLFGRHVRSLYYLFFVIHALTVATALIERRNDIFGQFLVVGAMAVLHAATYWSGMISDAPFSLGSVSNPRFIPALGIIPALHFLLILSDRSPFSAGRLVAVVLQSFVAFSVFHIRSTGAWIPVGVVLAAGASVLAMGWSRRREGLRKLWHPAFTLAWPALALVAVFAIGINAVSLSLHRSYKEGGWLKHHAFWHSVIYSLQFNPRYNKLYYDRFDRTQGDQMPLAVIDEYLKAYPEEDKPELYLAGKTLRNEAMEQLGRKAFFYFVRLEPMFVLETFFYVKPRLMAKTIYDAVESELLNGRPRRWIAAFFLAVFATGLAAARWPSQLERLRRLCFWAGLALLPCLGISFLTLPYLMVMTEQVIMTQVVAMLVLVLAVGSITRLVARRLRNAVAPGPAAPGNQSSELRTH